MQQTDRGEGLARFVVAQDLVYPAVEAELRYGRKRTHWMWFVFPQLRGLGSSERAQTYGISSIDEARAYLAHPLLGRRLRACTVLVLAARDRSLHDIFGSPDDVKFRSSMSLFALASSADGSVFQTALERYCDGRLDEATVALLSSR